jgi:hypothetical protein
LGTRLVSVVASAFAAVLVASGAWAHEGHDTPPSGQASSGRTTITEGGFYPTSDEGRRVFGYAKMLRHDRSTEVAVHVSGLAPHRSYPVHVHAGSCRAMGPHYRHDPKGPGKPPNELWPSSDPDDPTRGLMTDGGGYGTAWAQSSWTARPEATSVMLHDRQSGDKIACADLR